MNSRKLAQDMYAFSKVFLKDPRRKSILRVLWEYGSFRVSNPALAEQYFRKFLYRKGVKNFSDYLLTHKMERASWSKLNDRRYTPLMDNKRFFELFFSQFDLRVVKSLAHNCRSLFFHENRVLPIHSCEEFVDFLRTLIHEKAASGSVFIKKTQGSYGGAHIYKVTGEDLESGSLDLRGLYREVTASDYVFQDTIVQHERMNAMNPHSVNTVRMTTYTNKMKSPRILFSFLRTGVTKAYVDNISSGGLFVDIDVAKGSLRSEALTHVLHGGGKTYTHHPGSGLKFADLEIPFYKEGKELALEAARLVPHLRIVGWDIAIQPDGPILLEGNSMPGLYRAEIGQEGYRKNPLFMEFFTEITG